MKAVALISFFVLFQFPLFSQDAFITTWKTDNPGPSDDYTIHIPLVPESSYNFSVDWGDGTTENFTGLGSEITVYHSYLVIDTYTVEITGDFPRIYFNELGDSRNKILSIQQWGNVEWESFESAFNGCNNLQVLANDNPDLSQVGSLENMFRHAHTFNESINNWDVSNISNMKGMFTTASSFNQALDLWDVSGVTDMSSMFSNAHAFNQPLEMWDVSNVVSMSSMFSNATNFNQPLNQWNVSNVTNMAFMFSHLIAGNSSFNQPLNSWDVSSVTNMNSMFAFATYFDQPLYNWDVSNVTDLTWMFRSSPSFNQPIGMWNVSDVTNLYGVFWAAESFNHSISSWNVGNVTNFSFAFRDNLSFDHTLGSWDMTNATDVSGMLNNSAFSPCSYDSTLVGWSQQELQANLELGVIGLQHTQIGAEAKQSITNDFGWSIFGDELVVLPELVVTFEVNGTEISIFASEGLGNYTYFWTGPNGFTSTDSSIIAPQNGTYTVIVSDGCNQWTETFEILTVGISHLEADSFQLFPNPTTGLIYGFSNISEYNKIQVFDLNGKQVFESDFTSNVISFDLSHMESGFYLGRLMDKNGLAQGVQRICVMR